MHPIIQEDLKNLRDTLDDYRGKITNKTFLVTGGAGFLGSWFCDVLDSFNGNIVCVDNLFTGDLKNIQHLIGKPSFKFIQHDITQPLKIEEKIDYIVHMASIASPPIYQQYPIETLNANVIGTINMLELAKEKNVKGFLLASTSEVYGSPPDEAIPTPEDFFGFVNSYGPRSCYDEGKRVAEAYCYSYFKQFKLPIRIARIFNTCGPKSDTSNTGYGRVIIKFIDQALKGKPLTVYGEGKQTRSFCYVTDTIHGLLKLLLIDGLDGEVFNIGNDKEIRIIDLAYKIKDITKSNSEIIFQPLPKDDPLRRCPNLAKAKRLLNYEPKVDLEEGLRKTTEWYKSVMK